MSQLLGVARDAHQHFSHRSLSQSRERGFNFVKGQYPVDHRPFAERVKPPNDLFLATDAAELPNLRRQSSDRELP